MIIDEDTLTGAAMTLPPVVAECAPVEKEVARDTTAFEHGFRVGRTEGLIALVDAMTEALGPDATIEDSDQEAIAKGSLIRRGPDFVNLLLGKARPSILIVDDEPINIDLLADTFAIDYEVFAANDGKTALETAKREIPELILLDVMMPGMDGYEVCRHLKGNRQTQNIPVIFISALGGGDAEIRGLELGARDFLTKPVDPTAVMARVNNQVKLKYAQDKLVRLSTLEQTLRKNLLEALESKARPN
jgi:CheY-like chemotaxis protein